MAQLLVMIRNKSITDTVSRKFGVTGQAAIDKYINKVLVRRSVRNVVLARLKYESIERCQWKDGMIVGIFPDMQKWGKMEKKHFLIVKAAFRDEVNRPTCEMVKEETLPWEEHEGEVLYRATYKFPYWDYLSADEISKVRSRDLFYQPFLHRAIAFSQLVRTDG